MSVRYREDRSIENIIFLLSKKTKICGLKDLIMTLQETNEVLYANPFYYYPNNEYNRFAITNNITVKLNPKTNLINLDKLAEKYNFEYKYAKYGSSITIQLNQDAVINITELSCILYKTRNFKFVNISKIDIMKNSNRRNIFQKNKL